MQNAINSAKQMIDQERQKAVQAELSKLAKQYCMPDDALVGIVTEYVPTLADYDEAHTEPAMRNLRQRGFHANDAIHVIRLTQELRQALTSATQWGGPI